MDREASPSSVVDDRPDAPSIVSAIATIERAALSNSMAEPDLRDLAGITARRLLMTTTAPDAMVIDALVASPMAAVAILQAGVTQGLGDGAVAVAGQMVARKPGNVAVLDISASLLLALGRPDEALQLARKMRDLDPSNDAGFERAGESAVALALQARDVGDQQRADDLLSEARKDLDRAIELGPNAPLGRFQRAWARHLSGDGSGAEADISRVIELQPENASAYNLRGLIRASRADIPAALEDFITVTGLAPAWPMGWSNRGDAESSLGRLDEATDHYQHALELQPDLVATRFGLARLHERQDHWSAVLETLAPLTGAAADDPAVANLRGLALTEVADEASGSASADLARQAIASFDSALRRAPEESALYYNRARAYRVLGDSTRAIADCDTAEAMTPKDPDIPYLRALCRSFVAAAAVDRGDLPEATRESTLAIGDYDRVTELEPSNVRAAFGRAELRSIMGDWDMALADYRRSLELAPQMVDALVGRAVALDELGRRDEALVDLETALDLSPGITVALVRRGMVRAAMADTAMAAGNEDEAVNHALAAKADYDEALNVDPGSTDALIQRGMVLMFLAGQSDDGPATGESKHLLERAREDFTVAISQQPTQALGYVYRGDAIQQLGDTAAALADFERAMELDPGMGEAYTGRGILREREADYSGALEDYLIAVELDPTSREAWRNVAEARMNLGDTDRAIDAYNKAIENGHATAELLVARAEARIAIGDLDLAMRDLDLAVAVEPEDASLYLRRADQLITVNEFERATWDYETALALDPASYFALRGRAYAHLQLGAAHVNRRSYEQAARAYAESIDDSRAAIALDPTDPWGERYLGYGLRAREAYDLAADAFQRAAATAQDDNAFRVEAMAERADALRSWGHGLIGSDATERAIVAFDEILAGSVDGVDRVELGWIHGSHGEALTDAGRYDEAIASLRRAQKLDPANLRARVALATAELRRGHLDAARAGFAKALEKGAVGSDQEVWARVGWGIALQRLGDTNGARSANRAALIGPPVERHLTRCVWLDELGEHEAAISDARAATTTADRLARKRKFVHASEPHNQLAWLLTLNSPTDRRLQDAIRHGRIAVDLAASDYDSARALDTLGWALYTAGQLDEAIELIGQAVKVDPYDLLLRSHLEEAKTARHTTA